MIHRRRWRSTALADLTLSATAGGDGPGSRPASEALRFAMTVLEGWEYRCSGGDGMLLDQKVGRGGDSRGKFRLSEVGILYYVIYVIYVVY